MNEYQDAQPILWSPDHGWDDNLAALHHLWDKENGAMNDLRGVPDHRQTIIDELALLLPKEVVPDFINDAVQNGWVYFNNSVDTVHAQPFGVHYGVQYHFLRHPAEPWRFELMVKRGGISPLHDSLNALAHNGWPVVHASYKPANGESEQNYAWAQAELNDAGYVLAQECRATYGRFGYWRALNDERAFYLKPRINVRDAEGLR